jgi:1-acyl-sn-glycerol-3-phosphate acyltransferase
MISSGKKRWFEPLFDIYTKRLLRRSFHSVLVAGAHHGDTLDRNIPIILYANHCSWWDGIVPYYLSRELFGLDAYAMMEKRQLDRYRFFRWIGAFPVVREDPREAWRSVRYAASLFSTPGRAVWIFPQGEIRPAGTRPLGFSTGIGHLVRMVGRVQAVPIAFRYEFRLEQRPDCFVAIGPPVFFDTGAMPREATALLERVMTDLLDRLQTSVHDSHGGGFTPVLTGRSSMNASFDRALSWRSR